ncbi:B(0,+)-type amino acid transporter 1-like isoform X1 [Aphelenchoides bicaudatus]|nr:B(0,+)-type amino acid transporter 1-like isoform X1 [Aphelenchoides bicaudatus]
MVGQHCGRFSTTKVLLLLAAIVLACIKGKFSNLNRPFENSTLNPDDVVGSFYNSWFSFDGYDIVATSVEEIIDPQIILPKAISCSMLTVIAMYLLINVSYALVLGTDQMIKSENIVNDFAEVLLGKQSYLIPVLACICLFGAIYGTVFEIGRITHAMARDGVIPKCLSGWNEDKNIPRPAIFVHFVFGVIFLFLMNLNELNTLNAAQYVSQWLQRAISVFVLLFIRVNRFPVGESVFRMNILFPCLYLVCLVSMALSTVATDWQTSIFTIAASGGGLIIYWTLQWPKGLRRSGTIDRMLKSLDGKLRIQNGTN